MVMTYPPLLLMRVMKEVRRFHDITD